MPLGADLVYKVSRLSADLHNTSLVLPRTALYAQILARGRPRLPPPRLPLDHLTPLPPAPGESVSALRKHYDFSNPCTRLLPRQALAELPREPLLSLVDVMLEPKAHLDGRGHHCRLQLLVHPLDELSLVFGPVVGLVTSSSVRFLLELDNDVLTLRAVLRPLDGFGASRGAEEVDRASILLLLSCCRCWFLLLGFCFQAPVASRALGHFCPCCVLLGLLHCLCFVLC
jgi:hypothetical protein